jgi:uncharacterized protein (TIGR02646 family)
MKYIRKIKEPNSLTQYRQQQGAYYDGYPQKDELRDSLLKEQKYICCYCMQRIDKKKMKIEHWFPRFPKTNLQEQIEQLKIKGQTEQLNYNNLLAACLGNEGEPKHLQHCDTYKGNTNIKINPVLQICESLIKFKANGEIYADDADIDNDLAVTLNLNYQTIVKNRKVVLDTAYEKLAVHKGLWSKELLQKEIDRWENGNSEEYQPYCQIVIYHLKKKLAKL